MPPNCFAAHSEKTFLLALCMMWIRLRVLWHRVSRKWLQPQNPSQGGKNVCEKCRISAAYCLNINRWRNARSRSLPSPGKRILADLGGDGDERLRSGANPKHPAPHNRKKNICLSKTQYSIFISTLVFRFMIVLSNAGHAWNPRMKAGGPGRKQWPLTRPLLRPPADIQAAAHLPAGLMSRACVCQSESPLRSGRAGASARSLCNTIWQRGPGCF